MIDNPLENGSRKRSLRLPFSGTLPIAAIVLAYLTLGAIYAVTTPIFEKPDENWHFFTALYIKEHHRLPVVSPGVETLFRQEGAQAPLYYVLAALAMAPLDTSSAEQLLWQNPQGNRGNPADPGNHNVFIHAPFEGFPDDAILAVYAGRFLSLVIGVLAVIGTYGLIREIAPPRPDLALAAAALVAFTPQWLFIASSFSNDALFASLSALVLWQLAVGSRQSAVGGHQSADGSHQSAVGGREPAVFSFFSPRRHALLGLVLGLAMLSRASGLLLAALCVPVLLYTTLRSRSSRIITAEHPVSADRAGAENAEVRNENSAYSAHSAVNSFLLVYLPALLLSGWWYVRNLVLYSDLTGLGVLARADALRTDFPRTLAEVLGEFRGLRWSYWGLFGWFNQLMPIWVYWVIDLITILALIGLFFRLWRRLDRRPPTTDGRPPGVVRRPPAAASGEGVPSAVPRHPTPLRHGGYSQQPGLVCRLLITEREGLLLLLAWACLGFAALVPWTLTVKASQGRLLFGQLAAIQGLLVLGLAVLFGRRIWLNALWPATFFILATLLPFTTIAPPYAHPKTVQLSAIPPAASRPDLIYEGGIRLLAVQAGPESVTPGEHITLTLFWQTDRPQTRDLVLNLRLLGREYEPVAAENTYPGWGTFPVALWQPGRVYRDVYRLPVAADAETPMLARWTVWLEDLQTGERLGMTSATGTPLDPLAGVAITRLPPMPPPTEPDHSLDVRFEDFARLTGVSLRGSSLELHWEALAPPPDDYTVFIHLLRPDGALAAAADGPPFDGFYPTTAWLPGDRMVDAHALPANLSPGVYTVAVGLYRPRDGARARAFSIDAELQDGVVHVPLEYRVP